MKVAIIGAGVGGLGAAVRFANGGHEVTVFEANSHSGGKINNLQLGDFRWDMGPSVFTGPEYVKQLYDICGEDFSKFEYFELENSFNYFFSDGQRFTLPKNKEKLIETFVKELGEDGSLIKKYLDKSGKNYKSIAPVFIESSLHRANHLLTKKLFKALSRLPKYKLSKTMNDENKLKFKNPKTTQIFNRYATYNGSSPYKAPAMLNMIQHLEMNVGVFLPKKGMVQIPRSLQKLAESQGAEFNFNEKVEEILYEDKKIKGLKTSKGSYDFDIVVSNMDIAFTYKQLLPNLKTESKKSLQQEKSTSAIVFYWGINGSFPELGVHNMFFSEDYEAEFNHLFKTKTFSEDPSIYIHITSKKKKEDAPEGKENWFVMVNSPINVGQDWQKLVPQVKESLIKKISAQLKTDISGLIEEEFIMDPIFIEKTYSGAQGSIYGNASNNKYAAFYRHPNFSKDIKGLYFVGVTVHPGGGIPLALNSAKIAMDCFKEDYKKS